MKHFIYFHLGLLEENPMDRGAWWAAVHGFARVRHDLDDKSQSTKLCNGMTDFSIFRLGDSRNYLRFIAFSITLKKTP